MVPLKVARVFNVAADADIARVAIAAAANVMKHDVRESERKARRQRLLLNDDLRTRCSLPLKRMCPAACPNAEEPRIVLRRVFGCKQKQVGA